MLYYLYLVTNERHFHPDIGNYRSSSLHCYRRTPYTRELISLVPDVSTDEEFVQSLADLFTDGQLEPIHLFDAVYDAIP